jgi:hypothetical protein
MSGIVVGMKKPAHRPKGGAARTPAKIAAARENGKLGGRPRKDRLAATPRLFIGHFGYDGTRIGSGETEDGRFTAAVEATDIHHAVRMFRRLLQGQRPDFFTETIELLNCVEVKRMPPSGFISFFETINRNAATGDPQGGIRGGSGRNLGEAVGKYINTYGHHGPFLKAHTVKP